MSHIAKDNEIDPGRDRFVWPELDSVMDKRGKGCRRRKRRNRVRANRLGLGQHRFDPLARRSPIQRKRGDSLGLEKRTK